MVVHKYKLASYGVTKRLIGVGDNLPEPLLFREKLYVFDGNGKRIGRFSLNIDQEDSTVDSNKILYVHISNRAFVNGNLSESIVTGTVTHKLRTLEEIRYECTEISESVKQERCMFLLRERTKYYLSVTNSFSDLKSHSHTSIPFIETLALIGESANAVLLRKLAISGHEGILCLKTVLSNGKRCKNYYVTKLSEQVVNGDKMQVLIVYRNITNHRKCNITMTLALTRTGQIIYLFWSNSKYFLHIDPNININTRRRSQGECTLYNYWHKDLQLHSLYLDHVNSKLIYNKSFKYERDELKRILGDFVEHLLLSKPSDVICFAIQYFTAFGHNCMTKCASKTMYSESSEKSSIIEEYEVEREEEEEEMYSPWMGEAGFFCGP